MQLQRRFSVVCGVQRGRWQGEWHLFPPMPNLIRTEHRKLSMQS